MARLAAVENPKTDTSKPNAENSSTWSPQSASGLELPSTCAQTRRLNDSIYFPNKVFSSPNSKCGKARERKNCRNEVLPQCNKFSLFSIIRFEE